MEVIFINSLINVVNLTNIGCCTFLNPIKPNRKCMS